MIEIVLPLATILLLLGFAALWPRHPDRPYLPPGSRGRSSSPLAVAEQPGAGALTIERGEGVESARGTVVLVHGGGNDRLFGLWTVIDELNREGYRVVTFHQAGHGAGGDDRFSLAAARERLDAVVRQCRRHDGPLVLLGQSLGAALSLDLVARDGDVDGVVAVSAPCDLSVGPRVAAEALGLTRPWIYRALGHGSVYEVLPAAGAFRRGRFPVRVPRDVSYLAEFARAVAEMALEERLAARLQRDYPVKVVHGAGDGVIPVEQARRIALALGARAELRTYPRVTHLDPLFTPAVVRDILDGLAHLGREGT
jgi:alpha-beta hydrolase superfamily lysophospholipase